MTAHPSVTVLMPVYNAEKHLAEALDSILAQTYTDFELLCVEDGSMDSSPEILARYAAKDCRIRIIFNDENKGIAFSLNRGLREARAELVARMDSDDVSLPNRLALQAAFMAANPDVLVCSGAMVLYETGVRVPLPSDDETIKVHLLWASPFCHPAVIFRRKPVLEAGGYDSSMVPAEDYDLWTRLAGIRGWRFANLEANVLRYREYPELDRGSYKTAQRAKAAMVAEKQLGVLGLAGSRLDREAHAVLAGLIPSEAIPVQRLCDWVELLIGCNRQKELFPPDLFERVCRARMLSVAVRAGWAPFWAKRLIPAGIKLVVKRLLFAGRR